jgi:hypothetical protein
VPAHEAQPAQLWAIPANLTEASLPHGTLLARRIPDALARLLRQHGAIDARWAPVVIEVPEGLGYSVHIGSADEIEPREILDDLGGDYLFYGQIDLSQDRLWLDARLFSRDRDEVLIYPRFWGERSELLRALPRIAGQIAVTLGCAGPAVSEQGGEEPPAIGADLLTGDWGAFEHYCGALDELSDRAPEVEEEARAMDHLLAALEADSGFRLAARLGTELIRLEEGCEGVEHRLELADQLAARCPDLPELALVRAELLDAIGRYEEARQEMERARRLAQG